MRRGFLLWCCPAGWRGNWERAPEISRPFSISETARVPSRFLEMSAHMTELAKARWRSPKTWGFDPMRETVARGEAFCISCSLAPETEGRGRSRKLMRKGKNCFRHGKLPFRLMCALFSCPLVHWKGIRPQTKTPLENAGGNCERKTLARAPRESSFRTRCSCRLEGIVQRCCS